MGTEGRDAMANEAITAIDLLVRRFTVSFEGNPIGPSLRSHGFGGGLLMRQDQRSRSGAADSNPHCQFETFWRDTGSRGAKVQPLW